MFVRHVSEHGWFSLLYNLCDQVRSKVILASIFGLDAARKGGYIGRLSTVRGKNNIRIGAGFYAREMLWLDAIVRYGGNKFNPRIEIGQGVSFSRNVHVAAVDLVQLGDGVLVGSNVIITDHFHGDGRAIFGTSQPYSHQPLVSRGPVIIERNVWIGDGVAIMPGVTIGEGTVIGANSVVTKSVPAYSTIVGIPGRPLANI